MVIFLAGITSVPKDVLDAATVDGAGFWRRNYQIIMPIIAADHHVGADLRHGVHLHRSHRRLPADMGGPVNATQVLGSLGFQVGILSGDVATAR